MYIRKFHLIACVLTLKFNLAGPGIQANERGIKNSKSNWGLRPTLLWDADQGVFNHVNLHSYTDKLVELLTFFLRFFSVVPERCS